MGVSIMACETCRGEFGRNVLANLVIMERLQFEGSEPSPFDIQDVCTALECLVRTLLDGCEVRYSIAEVADGHQQDPQG